MNHVFILIGEDDRGTFFRLADDSTEEDARKELHEIIAEVHLLGGNVLFSKGSAKEQFEEALLEAIKLVKKECRIMKKKFPRGLENDLGIRA